MATVIRRNERSWAIDLISKINLIAKNNDLVIKKAGGETTVSTGRGNTMFPDVVLYGNVEQSVILQGWELKMPDVPIEDETFIKDAQRKAIALNLNSCLIWNFTYITDFTGKHWKIRLPQYAHFTRLDTLDERWTPEHIQRTMGAYASFGNRRATITYPPQMPQSLRDWFKPFQKTSHIYRLYLHYCYLLGVLPKKTTYRPTSPYLKEDLKKLEELSEQVRYMSKYGIETFDDLYADRDKLQGEMDKLIAYRTKLQNKIRRASPAEKETLREEKSKVTEQITVLRKQLKLNKGIEERSMKI